MTEDSAEDTQGNQKAIEYRDLPSIIEPAISELAPINEHSATLIMEITKAGFFETHQPKGEVVRNAKLIIDTILEDDR